MSHSEWRLSFGANVLDRNRTQFRLWAPAQSEVSLEIDGRASLPMTPRNAGWFEIEADCGAGAVTGTICGRHRCTRSSLACSGAMSMALASLSIRAHIHGVTELARPALAGSGPV